MRVTDPVFRRDRRTPVLAGFTAGAVLTGLGLTAYILIRGPEAGRIVGVASLPIDWAGWWAFVGLSAALGAAVGAVGAIAAWLLSRSGAPGSPRAPGRPFEE